MEYRVLGETGLNVSVIGIGTWQLSGPLMLDGKPDGFPDPGEASVLDLFAAAKDLGINFIDTAPMYGDGEGERRVGKAIHDERAHWIVSTKFGMQASSHGQRMIDTRPSAIAKSLEDSLTRLRTDYVDVYLYHSAPDIAELAEAREVLKRLKEEGKIRSFGISGNSPGLLHDMESVLCPEVVMYSQSLIRKPTELLQFVEKNGCGGIVRGVFEGGRLTGKYFKKPAGFRRDDVRSNYMAGEDFRQYAAFEPFIPEGAEMMHLALRYVLDFETTHTVVLGSRSIEGYENAAKALDLPGLQDVPWQDVERVGQRLSVLNPSKWTKIKRRLKNVFK